MKKKELDKLEVENYTQEQKLNRNNREEIGKIMKYVNRFPLSKYNRELLYKKLIADAAASELREIDWNVVAEEELDLLIAEYLNCDNFPKYKSLLVLGKFLYIYGIAMFTFSFIVGIYYCSLANEVKPTFIYCAVRSTSYFCIALLGILSTKKTINKNVYRLLFFLGLFVIVLLLLNILMVCVSLSINVSYESILGSIVNIGIMAYYLVGLRKCK